MNKAIADNAFNVIYEIRECMGNINRKNIKIKREAYHSEFRSDSISLYVPRGNSKLSNVSSDITYRFNIDTLSSMKYSAAYSRYYEI